MAVLLAQNNLCALSSPDIHKKKVDISLLQRSYIRLQFHLNTSKLIQLRTKNIAAEVFFGEGRCSCIQRSILFSLPFD